MSGQLATSNKGVDGPAASDNVATQFLEYSSFGSVIDLTTSAGSGGTLKTGQIARGFMVSDAGSSTHLFQVTDAAGNTSSFNVTNLVGVFIPGAISSIGTSTTIVRVIVFW